MAPAGNSLLCPVPYRSKAGPRPKCLRRKINVSEISFWRTIAPVFAPFKFLCRCACTYTWKSLFFDLKYLRYTIKFRPKGQRSQSMSTVGEQQIVLWWGLHPGPSPFSAFRTLFPLGLINLAAPIPHFSLACVEGCHWSDGCQLIELSRNYF